MKIYKCRLCSAIFKSEDLYKLKQEVWAAFQKKDEVTGIQIKDAEYYSITETDLYHICKYTTGQIGYIELVGENL